MVAARPDTDLAVFADTKVVEGQQSEMAQSMAKIQQIILKMREEGFEGTDEEIQIQAAIKASQE